MHAIQINAWPRRAAFALFVLGFLALGVFVTSDMFAALLAKAVMGAASAQRLLQGLLTNQLEAARAGSSLQAAWGLSLVGFLYGALHAVGPGHGKIVVSSYLLATKSSLKRGIAITILGSLLQGLVAIVLVLSLFHLVALARDKADFAAAVFEQISYALIAGLGLMLIWKGAKSFWRPTHHDGCGCGCQGHAPSPAALDKAKGIAPQAFLIFSIGIRPCSGALLLLFFTCMMGLEAQGVLATLAMAAGTALTTSALAVATVLSKEWAVKKFGDKAEGSAKLHAGLSLAGGFVVLLFALVFLTASFQGAPVTAAPPGHPLMRSLGP